MPDDVEAELVERLRKVGEDRVWKWDWDAAQNASVPTGLAALCNQAADALATLRTALADAEKRAEGCREALERAAHQFRSYAQQHLSKHTPDGDAKARTNTAFADMCKAALFPPAQSVGTRAERAWLLVSRQRSNGCGQQRGAEPPIAPGVACCADCMCAAEAMALGGADA